MVIMSFMIPSIDTSVAVICTAKGCAVEIWFAYCCFSSCGSMDHCGELRSSVSQDSYQSISLPRSIASPLTVVYSAGSGVVQTGYHKQRKSSSLTIAMHANTVVAFACIRW